MLRTFLDYDYAVEWRVINAADYGFPQRRRRVFIFAAHKSTNYFQNLSKEKSTDILLENGFFQDEFKTEKEFIKEPEQTNIDANFYNDLVNVSDDFQFSFNNSGIMIEGQITTVETKPIFVEPKPLRDILIENAPEYLFLDEEAINKLKFLKGAKKEKRVNGEGFVYYYSEGQINFPDSLDKPARTMLTSEGTVNRSTHVIEDPNVRKLRLLSPIECERLNGFPDNWTKPNNCPVEINDRRRYFFMGNALVVGLIEKMGKSLTKIYDMERQ